MAQWHASGHVFWYLRQKFSKVFAEKIRHPEDDDGYDLFIPVRKIQMEQTKAEREWYQPDEDTEDAEQETD
jgi:hypothetical protein